MLKASVPAHGYLLKSLVAAVWLVLCAPVMAQDVVLEGIGVVDLQQILRESVAALGVRDTVSQRQETYREEIAGKENGLRTEQEELQRQRTVLSPEVYETREREFDEKVEALQRDVVERNKELEDALAYGMHQVQTAALQIIAEMADSRGFAIVLDKSQVLLVATEMDFSLEVVETLNERLPSVSTERPAAEGE